jgi:putative effector of murein hydrolase
VTTAVGLALSEQAGGDPAIATAAIIITGILGSMIGPLLCKLLRIRHPVAQGVALGTASHVIGTSKAHELSELTGAVSSLSLTVAAVLTALLFPLFVG